MNDIIPQGIEYIDGPLSTEELLQRADDSGWVAINVAIPLPKINQFPLEEFIIADWERSSLRFHSYSVAGCILGSSDDYGKVIVRAVGRAK